MARTGTDVKVAGVEGLAFGRVRFSGSIPHGPGKRTIWMTVEADDICRLADAIRGCPHNYEEPSTGRKPRTLEEAKQSRYVVLWCGHAVWHIEHPDRPMPCRPDDERLIDVEHPLAKEVP